MLAAGIVKASSGCVLIGDYDPRVQSVACKRIAGFVPRADFLAPAAHAMLYRRGAGRLRSALDLPATDDAIRLASRT